MLAERAFSATDRLAEFPRSARVVPELARPSIREVFVFSYRVIYRCGDERVDILTVFHGARLLDSSDVPEA